MKKKKKNPTRKKKEKKETDEIDVEIQLLNFGMINIVPRIHHLGF